MDLRDYYRLLASEISEIDMRKAVKILAGHIGKENAISKRELVIAIYGKYTVSTERKTREVISRLVRDYSLAIGSNSGSSGYYICGDVEEKRDAVKELYHRAEMIRERGMELARAQLPELSLELNKKQEALF